SDQLILGEAINENELGFVGQVTKVNRDLLEILLEKDHIPVIAPLGITETGQWLNINADEVACKVAATLQAEALYLLTDVPGIKQQGSWLKKVSLAAVDQLVKEEIVTGGMLPKLNSAKEALLAGVTSVVINNGITAGGTQLFAEEYAV